MKTSGLDIFGDDSPALPSASSERSLHRWRGTFLGLVGAGAGAFVWKKHRYLGAFGGYILGHDGYRLVANEGARTSAFVRMGSAGAAIAGAMLLPITPALGFAIGLIGGHVVASFLGDGDE